MKIGQTPASPGVAPTGSAATSARPAPDGAHGSATARTGKTEGSSTVQLSSTARALLDGADSSFDAEKVERVRQSISDGTYKINPEAIADKLIANAQDVLGKVTSSR
jgi:negative regulator of flagellin synthesis FlgM